MKKALLLSLTLLFAGSTVTVQTKAMEVKEVITPADEALEIVPFEIPNTRKEVSISEIAQKLAFPVAIAGLAASLFYIRAFKPELAENANPNTIINKISKQVNNLFALSYKYKDPIHDTISVCLLVSVGKAALCGNLTDMFNNASKNLPFGMGNFMKAKEPKDCGK